MLETHSCDFKSAHECHDAQLPSFLWNIFFGCFIEEVWIMWIFRHVEHVRAIWSLEFSTVWTSIGLKVHFTHLAGIMNFFLTVKLLRLLSLLAAVCLVSLSSWSFEQVKSSYLCRFQSNMGGCFYFVYKLFCFLFRCCVALQFVN